MFKFGGFKASLSFYNGNRRKSKKEHGEIGSSISISGAYRTNRDEFFGYNLDSQRKSTQTNLSATIMEQPTTPLRQVRSTSDLIKNKNLPANLQQENPGVSQDPRGAEQIETRKSLDRGQTKEKRLDAEKRVEKKRLLEQKKIEKQRLDEQKKIEKQILEEQKKREKLASQEQAKEEKLRKEREKKEAQQAKKEKKKKRAAPQRPLANPLANAASSNPLAQSSAQTYSTNTLDSSISKTSGPPPYSDISKRDGEQDSTGNVTYIKPVDTGSWDMISKHRQNINRPINVGSSVQSKQTVMDLNYKLDEGNEIKENSDA